MSMGAGDNQQVVVRRVWHSPASKASPTERVVCNRPTEEREQLHMPCYDYQIYARAQRDFCSETSPGGLVKRVRQPYHQVK